MHLFDRATVLLEKALGLRLERHNLIASNLANMDTPGYRARDFSFAAELRRAMEQAPVSLDEASNSSLPAPQVLEEGKVDLDKEMARMAENRLMHDAASRLIAKKFELLKYAIGEGGK